MTVGLELEWADVDRWSEIPSHLGTWNDQDYSIVNSDGHANDPTGQTWRWGGEINTVPTETAIAQGDIVRELAKLLSPVINYKCNLHVHVKPDVDLLQDLPLLKQVAAYIRKSEQFVYDTIDPITPPSITLLETDPEAYKGEVTRYRRNLKSHHGMIPLARWAEMLSAETVQEFKDAHAPPTKAGGRAWHIVQRTGMNLRSLWKHGTIEFRHFFGTADWEEVVHAVEWCRRFVECALGDVPVQQLYESGGPWRFPVAQPYDHQLAMGFEVTKWRK